MLLTPPAAVSKYDIPALVPDVLRCRNPRPYHHRPARAPAGELRMLTTLGGTSMYPPTRTNTDFIRQKSRLLTLMHQQCTTAHGSHCQRLALAFAYTALDASARRTDRRDVRLAHWPRGGRAGAPRRPRRGNAAR
ncbi:hypothetical protein H4582DRAFT_2085634 [Lactarius indigo]|nr:hypothetical protein H4582DRAFT_2085634 [Lactarius indigo]